MTEHLDILTSKSLEVLRTEASTNSQALFHENGTLKTLDELGRELKLDFQESPFSLPGEFKLRLPDGSDWSLNHDRSNAVALYTQLGGLTPSSATNEALWVTLGFGKLADYANARMAVMRDPAGLDASTAEISNSNGSRILTKRFAVRSRDRWREHPISRLWWVCEFANRFTDIGT